MALEVLLGSVWVAVFHAPSGQERVVWACVLGCEDCMTSVLVWLLLWVSVLDLEYPWAAVQGLACL